MPTVNLSDLAYDYLVHRRDRAEHQSMDSAVREVLYEADSDWRQKAREHRDEESDS